MHLMDAEYLSSIQFITQKRVHTLLCHVESYFYDRVPYEKMHLFRAYTNDTNILAIKRVSIDIKVSETIRGEQLNICTLYIQLFTIKLIIVKTCDKIKKQTI